MDSINEKYFYKKSKQINTKFIDILVFYIYIISAIITSIFVVSEYRKTVIFYGVIILVSVAFAALAQKSKTQFFFNIFLFLSFLVLFFVYGFRNFSAIDDNSYIGIFNNVAEIGWINQFLSTTMEPGYLIINQLVSAFTDNYLVMQLITSFIPLFLFYYGFNKYRHIISIPTAVFFLCTVLYFQMVSAGLVRVFIGVSIVFIALDFVPKKKPLKYIFLIVLASLFHYSAFFMIVLSYFAINKTNLSKRASLTYITIFIASPFIFLFVAKFIVPLLGKRYLSYGFVEGINLNLSTFSTLPIILLLLFFYKHFFDIQKSYFKLFVLTYALSLIIFLFGEMANLGRLIFYAYTALILAASMITKLLTEDSRKPLYSGIIIPYGFLYVYVTQFTLESHIPYLFPYNNIFFSI